MSFPHTAKRPLLLASLLAVGLLSAGCATRKQALYEWGGYQQQVYTHFKGGSPEEQLSAMEEAIQVMRSHGTTPPPGFHAHMGMLYAAIGKDDQALQSFQTEKALFPESAHYIDFLLSNAKKVQARP
jgi:hypothetical protein